MRPIEELADLLCSDRYSHQTLADGSGVVLDMSGLRVLSLNRTGMLVLDSMASGITQIDQLTKRLTESYDVDGETATRDVEELLQELDRLLTTPSRPR